MKTVSQINSEKSIKRKWLTYKESFSDQLDTFIHVFSTLALCTFSYTIMISQQKFNENERFIINISVFICLLFCLVTLKKITEKKLKVFETKNTEIQNKEMLKKIALKNGWIEFRSNTNALIFYHYEGDANTYIKIFLFSSHKIYYTVLTERFQLNYPTFTQNRSVRKLLENTVCSEKSTSSMNY